MSQPHYALLLRPLTCDRRGEPLTVPPIIRLRRLLKALERAYGFRVVEMAEKQCEKTDLQQLRPAD